MEGRDGCVTIRLGMLALWSLFCVQQEWTAQFHTKRWEQLTFEQTISSETRGTLSSELTVTDNRVFGICDCRTTNLTMHSGNAAPVSG